MMSARPYHAGMRTPRPFLRLAVVALLLGVLRAPSHGLAAGAAQATPAATPAASPASEAKAARYLPDAAVIGEGWRLAGTSTPEVDAAVFLDAAGAVYVGPAGARVAVTAWANVPGRAGVQRSWEAVGAIYADIRFEVTGPKDDRREEELAALPFPEGCVDARRIDGADPLYGLPGAITQCAVDPDVTVLVIVSGTVGGVSGYEASDRVATEAYRAGNR